jgi:DNA-binding NtrC family response regulator
MTQNRILVIEDGPQSAGLNWARTYCSAYDIETLFGDEAIRERLEKTPFPDVAVLNIEALKGGLERITCIRRAWPSQKIIVLLPQGNEETRTDALLMGADLCAWKPCDDQTLNSLIHQCLKNAGAGAASLEESFPDKEELGNGRFFVMASPAMRKLRAQVNQLARIDVPVLILGESGTGKEVVARLIHRISRRSQRPFLKINCAALPGELLESELFGYERGAFTGAFRSKPGMLEACNNGTLLLDEIAEMPPSLQAKLLHCLQDQEFSRLGSCATIKVNVRFLAATNVNIRDAIANRTFREDLYYRLGGFVFHVPPLRERKEDIPSLFQHYVAYHANGLNLPVRAISRNLINSCMTYKWPGNVRELENLAKRFLVYGEESLVLTATAADGVDSIIPLCDYPADLPTGDLKAHLREMRTSAEGIAISQALEQTRWNRTEAAKILKISYKSMLSKIRLYGLEQALPKPLGTLKIERNGLEYRVESTK